MLQFLKINTLHEHIKVFYKHYSNVYLFSLLWVGPSYFIFGDEVRVSYNQILAYRIALDDIRVEVLNQISERTDYRVFKNIARAKDVLLNNSLSTRIAD